MKVRVRWGTKKPRLGLLLLWLGLLWDGNNEAHLFCVRVLLLSGFVLGVVGGVKTEVLPKTLKTLFSNVLLNAGIAWFLFFLFYFITLETSIPYSALSAACCTGIVVGAFLCLPENDV